ncbi:MAG: response regulator [Chloroflexi bacterium]|nr:response regulator [Chloroflexota bacterium]
MAKVLVLVIEDMPDNAELARKVLTARGYEVILAYDAESGLKTAIEQHPDIILLDLGLPDYDGQTLAGWLRDESSLTHVPIVAVTAWPPETARQMVVSYGCNGYISKPINVASFADQITAFLKPSPAS